LIARMALNWHFFDLDLRREYQLRKKAWNLEISVDNQLNQGF